VDLPDGPSGLQAHALKGVIPGGDLQQQGVIVGGDLAAHAGGGRVQPDAEAAGRPVGGDLAGVGSEVVGRVLGGDAALDGVAVQVQVTLLPDADAGIAERTALGDQNLRAHQVHARHHLGDGVLHLDTGVHLDEVVVPFPVHQELQGAGVHIAHVLCDLHRVFIQGLTDLLVHGEGGAELHHLLIAPLERAIPLEQVDHVALFVAQHLHLDVLGLHQELLHEDVVIAEGLLGLRLHQIEVGAHLFHGVTPAHTAAAAAGGRLENDGEAELHSQLLSSLPALQGLCGAGGGGYAAGHGDLLGGQLVAHQVQNLGGGSDELDARSLAGPGKIRVLTEETVTGVNGIGAVLLSQLDDPGDVQIGAQGALVLSDQIGLVRGGAEEAVYVLIGVDGNGLEAQVVTGPEDPHGDLAPVGDQDLLECLAHISFLLLSAGRRESFGSA